MKMIRKTVAIAAIAAGAFTVTITNAYAGPEAMCKACHKLDSSHSVGPGLAGIVGRKAGSTDFKKYSKSLKAGGWVWDEKNLRKWLGNTKDAVKELSGDSGAKTGMPNQRLKGAKLDKVIEFLKGL
jgi:cytochrome c